MFVIKYSICFIDFIFCGELNKPKWMIDRTLRKEQLKN